MFDKYYLRIKVTVNNNIFIYILQLLTDKTCDVHDKIQRLVVSENMHVTSHFLLFTLNNLNHITSSNIRGKILYESLPILLIEFPKH